LKRFAIDRKRSRLWCYAKSRDVSYQSSIANLAVVSDYYTWTSGNELAGAVEHGMGILDSRAAEVLPKFERGNDLFGTEPNVVAAYLAIQRARVPAARANVQELIESVGARGAEQALLEQDTDEAFSRALAEHRVRSRQEFDELRQESLAAIQRGDVRVTMEPIMNFALQMQEIESLASFVEAMTWRVYDAPEGDEFLISDNPVVLSSESSVEKGFPPGFADPDVEVTLPLSRRRLLYVSHNQSCGGRATASADLVAGLNVRAWRNAAEYVYASSREALESVSERLAPTERTKPVEPVTFEWVDQLATFVPRQKQS
jgi:hypothetical protein